MDNLFLPITITITTQHLQTRVMRRMKLGINSNYAQGGDKRKEKFHPSQIQITTLNLQSQFSRSMAEFNTKVTRLVPYFVIYIYRS